MSEDSEHFVDLASDASSLRSGPLDDPYTESVLSLVQRLTTLETVQTRIHSVADSAARTAALLDRLADTTPLDIQLAAAAARADGVLRAAEGLHKAVGERHRTWSKLLMNITQLMEKRPGWRARWMMAVGVVCALLAALYALVRLRSH